MGNFANQPRVLECPSCGVTLALPDADTFLCDYCGKRIIVPRMTFTSSAAAGKC